MRETNKNQARLVASHGRHIFMHGHWLWPLFPQLPKKEKLKVIIASFEQIIRSSSQGEYRIL
jgi:hypothetical protein